MAKKKAEGAVSKMDAVRAALSNGADMAATAIPWIKEKFNLDINEATFNSYKSTIKNKAKNKEGGNKKADVTSGMPDDPLAAAKAVKELVDKYGVETVKGLADLWRD